MIKMCKKNFLFFAGLLSIFLMFTLYASMVPAVCAAEATVQEKGLTFLDNVVGLDMAEYDVTAMEHPAREDSSLGVPTVDVTYKLKGKGSRLEVLSTFVDGSLQMIGVLEIEGELILTEPLDGAGDVEMAKAFLGNYLEHTGDPLYGTLQSTLSSVESGRNATKTVGNMVLEVTVSGDGTHFRWYYQSNGAEAKYTKNIVLGFEDGFLKAFADNWHLYPVGSNDVALSEEDAIEVALETAKSHNWSLPVEEESLKAENFNQSNARWTSLVFDDSPSLNKSRGEDPLTLYPVWRVGIALDKWYGHLYGIEVDVWADTGEVRSIQEAWSTLPPPEGVPTANMSDDGEAGQESLDGEAEPNSTLGVLLVLSTTLTGVTLVWTTKTRNIGPHNSSKMRIVKAGGVTLCVLMFSLTLLTPIVNASGGAVIWGSESTGAGDYGGN